MKKSTLIIIMMVLLLSQIHFNSADIDTSKIGASSGETYQFQIVSFQSINLTIFDKINGYPIHEGDIIEVEIINDNLNEFNEIEIRLVFPTDSAVQKYISIDSLGSLFIFTDWEYWKNFIDIQISQNTLKASEGKKIRINYTESPTIFSYAFEEIIERINQNQSDLEFNVDQSRIYKYYEYDKINGVLDHAIENTTLQYSNGTEIHSRFESQQVNTYGKVRALLGLKLQNIVLVFLLLTGIKKYKWRNKYS